MQSSPSTLPLKADPPPEMSRADRQIIFAKISDVWDGERYCAGWTDKRLAADLNVPSAWVGDVREGFFGPEGSNPLLDQYLAAADEIRREQAGIVEMRKTALEHSAALRKRCDEQESRIRAVEALSKRVEKEIGR